MVREWRVFIRKEKLTVLAVYVINRVLQLIPVLFLVSLIVYFTVRLIPGDPVLVILGIDAEPSATYNQEQYRTLQQQLGLDRPVYVQYFNWLDKTVRGDFGIS